MYFFHLFSSCWFIGPCIILKKEGHQQNVVLLSKKKTNSCRNIHHIIDHHIFNTRQMLENDYFISLILNIVILKNIIAQQNIFFILILNFSSAEIDFILSCFKMLSPAICGNFCCDSHPGPSTQYQEKSAPMAKTGCLSYFFVLWTP